MTNTEAMATLRRLARADEQGDEALIAVQADLERFQAAFPRYPQSPPVRAYVLWTAEQHGVDRWR